MSEIRYQFFLSSTFEDLREERQQVIQAVLELGHIPVGMEVFPSADESPWEIIEKTISESDYYILLSAGRYGSVGAEGVSYTEREFDLASKLSMPVIGFLHAKPEDLPAIKRESNAERVKRLVKFHEKIKQKHVRFWNTPSELGLQASKAITYATRMAPRVGWVRADKARSFSDMEKLEALRGEISDLNKKIDELEVENEDLSKLIRSSVLPIDERLPEKLAQGRDVFSFEISYNLNGERVDRAIAITWDEIFRCIAPSMYQTLIRRGYMGRFDFEGELKSTLRPKVKEALGTQQLRYKNNQIDSIMFQFKQLGYFIIEQSDGASWWTLTPKGEEHLTTLLTVPKA